MNILVVGDSCKDVFIYGDCSRLAPAAPVPVFIAKYSKENKGMAGNVYQNIKSLDVNCGFITNENEITKTRYVEQKTNHMIMRIDSGEEKIDEISNLHLINFKKYNAIIISDYDKGFLCEKDIKYISEQHDLVFLDTKKILGDWARKVKYIKINEIEYEKTKATIIEQAWIYDKLIVTLGSEGCKFKGKTYPVKHVEIKDLTGAGDSFLAALVYSLVIQGDIDTAINFANECATKVVQLRGVNTIYDI